MEVYEAFEGVLGRRRRRRRRWGVGLGGLGDLGKGNGGSGGGGGREERGERGGEEEEEDEEEEEEEGEVAKALQGIYIHSLERAPRLRNDIQHISSSTMRREAKFRPTALSICSKSESESESQPRRPRLEAFTHHIRAVKPHLLLAYSWVLYMALFSGGRYIRATLRGAGVGFWGGRRVHEGQKLGGSSYHGGKGRLKDEGEGEGEGDGEDEDEGKGHVDVDVVDRYLGFWTFEGDEDGEDIKAEFKARFADVEGTLTEGEREEVVKEAVFIMQSMIGVVGEISEVLGTGASSVAGQPVGNGERTVRKEDEEPSMRWLLLKHVLPMGMVELIAAGARSAVGVGMGPSFWSARTK